MLTCLNFKVYPVPFNDILNIEYQLKKDAHVQISIYDVNGKLVQTIVSANKQVGDYKLIVNANSFEKGMYILKLKVDGQPANNRIIMKQ